MHFKGSCELLRLNMILMLTCYWQIEDTSFCTSRTAFAANKDMPSLLLRSIKCTQNQEPGYSTCIHKTTVCKLFSSNLIDWLKKQCRTVAQYLNFITYNWSFCLEFAYPWWWPFDNGTTTKINDVLIFLLNMVDFSMSFLKWIWGQGLTFVCLSFSLGKVEVSWRSKWTFAQVPI